MLDRIIKFLTRSDVTIAKKCTCGQQKDGVCIANITVSHIGVMSQDAREIMQCGEFQKQLDAASRIVKKHNNE